MLNVFGGMKKKNKRLFSIVLTLVFLFSGLFCIPASAATSTKVIVLPGFGLDEAKEFYLMRSDKDKPVLSFPVTDLSTNANGGIEMDFQYPFYQYSAGTWYSISKYNFWNDFALDPNSVYSFTHWCVVGKGATSWISSDIFLHIGSLRFKGEVAAENGNWSCHFTGTFKGSELSKVGKYGLYWGLEFTVLDPNSGSVFYWGSNQHTWFTASSGTDQVISELNRPIAPPDSQDEMDGTLSDYNQKEEQLSSSIDTGGVADTIGGMDLSGLVATANVFGDLFGHFWDKLGKLQLVSQFAVISGIVMLILGLGVTVGNVMEVNRLGQLREKEARARQEDNLAWRRYLVGRHRQQDAERMARNKGSGGHTPSYDISKFDKAGYDVPDLDD